MRAWDPLTALPTGPRLPPTHARVDDAIEHVREGVAREHDERRDERDGHEQRRIPAKARRDGRLAKAGVGDTCSTSTEPPKTSLTLDSSIVSAGTTRFLNP